MKRTTKQLPQVFDLQALRALAEEGTVSKASERLGMSQSALSYALDRMRQRFQDPLFVRVGNKMLPTPLAQDLQAPAQRVLQILETEIAGLKRFEPATAFREFRMAVNEIGAITMIPRLVRRLSVEAPNSRLTPVQLPAHSIASALESGEIDIVAGHFPQLAETLVHQRLFERSYVCVARADHPTIGSSITLEEFAAAPQVATPTVPIMTSWIDSQLSRMGLAANRFMVCQHVAAVPFIVSLSDLIAIMPEEVYLLLGPVAKLKVIKIPLSIPNVTIAQYWHPRMAADSAVRYLRELIFSTSRV